MNRYLLALALLAACESGTGPVESPNQVQGERPATEAQRTFGLGAYAYVADCLGLPNQSQLVRWHIATSVTINGVAKSGMMIGNDIWIDADYSDWHATYRHESMHHILWTATSNSDRNHTSPKWITCAECAPGVDCSDLI